MRLYRSNRVEALADALAQVVAAPTGDAFEPECVVVQSRGMATWLSMRLAREHGVWAGGEFPFPRRFVHRVFEAILPEAADALEAFAAPRLLWSILAELPGHLDHGAFKDLARFVADDPRGTGRFALAQHIAQVFDQYLVFRPNMLLAWEAGKEDHWQARLWRALVGRLGSRHLPGLARDFFEALDRDRFDRSALPTRVSVFGLSTLPPFFVRILAALGQRIPLHLFVVSPSQAWWADLRSHREALRDVRDEASDLAPEKESADTAMAAHGAPSLLASLGMVARDFQGIIEAAADYDEPSDDLYVEPCPNAPHSDGSAQPPAPGMLQQLQSDMLSLREREEPLVVRANDDSISVHACHSPMREVEVLHDRILALLAADPTLQPRDVLVMMSSIDTYAPPHRSGVRA